MPRASRAVAISLLALASSTSVLASESQRSVLDTFLVALTDGLRQGECYGDGPGDGQEDRIKLATMASELSDPNATFSMYGTQINAIDMAVVADDSALLEKLFAAGVRVRKENEKTVLVWAAAHDSTPTLVSLLTHGVDPNPHLEGNSVDPLEDATLHNRAGNVHALINAGARLERPPNAKGFNVLTAAVICKNQDLADFLIARAVRVTDYTKQKAAINGIRLEPLPSH